MTAYLFLGYLGLIAASVVSITAIYLPRRVAIFIIPGLAVWLLYIGALSYSGVIRDPSMRPPGAFLIVVPVFFFVVTIIVRSAAASVVAVTLPLWLLTVAQTFRVGVELFLHALWTEGLVPRLLTYEGGNVDLLIGISAPIVGWSLVRGWIGKRTMWGWNILGLLALANVVVRSVLTAPGPLNLIHTDVPNMAIGLFPYTFVAGFFAPLAIILHILSLRALSAGMTSK